MIALLCLVFFSLVLLAILVLLRRLRRREQMRSQALPQYSISESKHVGMNRNGLTIHTVGGMRSSVIVINKDGQPMLSNPRSPPHSPDNVPEIHITFPDEQDEQGRPKSGRVVVVRVGETSVGLEPLRDDEQLPAYEKESSGNGARFYAIDMDRIGGLKEKEPLQYV
jgi:hypothetical protein